MNYLNLAVQLALQNPIQASKQLFYGYNRYKTHPLQARFSSNPQSIYLHCERAALGSAIRGLSQGVSRRSVTDLSDYRLLVGPAWDAFWNV